MTTLRFSVISTEERNPALKITVIDMLKHLEQGRPLVGLFLQKTDSVISTAGRNLAVTDEAYWYYADLFEKIDKSQRKRQKETCKCSSISYIDQKD